MPQVWSPRQKLCNAVVFVKNTEPVWSAGSIPGLLAAQLDPLTTDQTCPWVYMDCPNKLAHFVLHALTSSNIDRFSNLFHCLNQENIRNNTVTKDPTTPQVCRLWNISVFKATSENKTTSVTTQLRVRRPSARRTHWTFDVKAAGCDSYFR